MLLIRDARPGLLLCGWLLAGCATLEPALPSPLPQYGAAERNAAAQRIERLQSEVQRLRDDLAQAEETLAAGPNGSESGVTRAHAVSALAEANIRLEQAAKQASWRRAELGQARAKLEEADRLIHADQFAAAAFFATRAARMSDALIREGDAARRTHNALWVDSAQLNVRAGPSTRQRVLVVLPKGAPVFVERTRGSWALVRTPTGELGWVYRKLLAKL